MERWNGKTEQDGQLRVRKNCMMSREKKTVVEEKRHYCETLVNMVARSELHWRKLVCIDGLQRRDGGFPPYSGEADIGSTG